MGKKAYILYADGYLDQVCDTHEQAQKEKRDLVAMGCSVKILVVPWDKQDDYQ